MRLGKYNFGKGGDEQGRDSGTERPYMQPITIRFVLLFVVFVIIFGFSFLWWNLFRIKCSELLLKKMWILWLVFGQFFWLLFFVFRFWTELVAVAVLLLVTGIVKLLAICQHERVCSGWMLTNLISSLIVTGIQANGLLQILFACRWIQTCATAST